MADNTVAITAGSGTSIRTVTNAGADGGAHQQVVTLGDSAGNLLGTSGAPVPVSVLTAIDPDTVVTGTITATDAVVAAPTGNGALLTGTPTASSFVTITAPGGDSSWDILVGASASTFGGGTVYFEGSFDGGTTWLPLNGRQTGIVNTVLGYSTTTAGVWRGNTSGVTNLRARIVGATAPSVSITLRIASGSGALFLNASVPAGANAIGTVGITGNPTFPDGSQSVDIGSHSIFLDPFDVNPNGSGIWNVGGTVTPTWAAGTSSMPLTTTISAYSYLTTTNATGTLFSGAYLKASFILSHEATATTNNARYWGFGILQGSPTAASPIVNGVGFELDPTTGGLLGVVFSAGTRTQTVTLTRQADAAFHKYSVYYRQSKAYFEVDNVIVGSINYPNMAQSQNLRLVAGSFNGLSAASQATTFNITSGSISDIGNNATAIMGGDATTGYLRATVTKPSSSAQGGDSALVVAIHPTTGLPAGTNLIGTIGIASMGGGGNVGGTISATDAVVGTPTGTGVPVSTSPTANSSVSYNVGTGTGTGYSNVDIQLTGTFGSGTVYFEGSQDQTNWLPVQVTRLGVLAPVLQYSTTTAGVFRFNLGGFQMIRARIVGATTPSVAVNFRATFQPASSSLSSLPGGSAFSAVTTAAAVATSVRTIPTALYELTVSNPTATAAYFKLFNKASAPTLGTDVPIMTIRVAATGSAGDTQIINFGTTGKAFSLGLAYGVTAAAAATDVAATVAGIQISLTTA